MEIESVRPEQPDAFGAGTPRRADFGRCIDICQQLDDDVIACLCRLVPQSFQLTLAALFTALGAAIIPN